MSSVGDFVKGFVADVVQDLLKKTTGKRTRRRKRSTTLTPSERLRRIERLIKPAKRQTSRKRTTRARSKTKRRAY